MPSNLFKSSFLKINPINLAVSTQYLVGINVNKYQVQNPQNMSKLM